MKLILQLKSVQRTPPRPARGRARRYIDPPLSIFIQKEDLNELKDLEEPRTPSRYPVVARGFRHSQMA